MVFKRWVFACSASVFYKRLYCGTEEKFARYVYSVQIRYCNKPCLKISEASELFSLLVAVGDLSEVSLVCRLLQSLIPPIAGALESRGHRS